MKLLIEKLKQLDLSAIDVDKMEEAVCAYILEASGMYISFMANTCAIQIPNTNQIFYHHSTNIFAVYDGNSEVHINLNQLHTPEDLFNFHLINTGLYIAEDDLEFLKVLAAAISSGVYNNTKSDHVYRPWRYA